MTHYFVLVVMVAAVGIGGCGGGGTEPSQGALKKPEAASTPKELAAIQKTVETAKARGEQCKAEGDQACLNYWVKVLLESEKRLATLKSQAEPSGFGHEVEEGVEVLKAVKLNSREGRRHESEELRGELAPSSTRARNLYRALNRELLEERKAFQGISHAAWSEAYRRVCGNKGAEECLGSPFVG